MTELHIKNHFVPECYLKRWEGFDSKICVYKSLVSHANTPLWRKRNTSAIAYQKHLYTQVISGSESDELEKWLDKEYESPANEVIEKVIFEKRLTANDWSILIKFLAAQDVRTPSRLIEHLKRNKEVYSEVLQGVLNDVKEKIDKKELSDIKRHNCSETNSNLLPLKVTTEFESGQETGILKVESYVGRSSWIYSIKHVLENTAKLLHNHKWTIVKPAKDYSWFTSDNPVIKLNYLNQNEYDLKGGWGKEKGNIIFPIGPDHAMFVQIGDKAIPKNSRLSIKQTLEFRKFMAENAHRMIFANFFDEGIPALRVRIVNDEWVKREKLEFQNWHEKNSKMEQEFSSGSNKNS